jgi:hypothetical protein
MHVFYIEKTTIFGAPLTQASTNGVFSVVAAYSL